MYNEPHRTIDELIALAKACAEGTLKNIGLMLDVKEDYRELSQLLRELYEQRRGAAVFWGAFSQQRYPTLIRKDAPPEEVGMACTTPFEFWRRIERVCKTLERAAEGADDSRCGGYCTAVVAACRAVRIQKEYESSFEPRLMLRLVK